MPPPPGFDEMSLEIRKAPAAAGYLARVSVPACGYHSDWGACDSSLWNLAGATPEWIYGVDPQADGARIFQWLTHDPKLSDAWSKAETLAPQRRLRLDLDASAPELAQVPWELACKPGAGTGWVAGATATPFSRQLAGGFDPALPIQDRPIRILVAISSPAKLPAGFSPIPEQEFWERLEAATQKLVDAGQVDLRRLPAPVTLENLEAELLKGYHILHFVGHGLYQASTGTGLLYLRHETANKDHVSAADFAAMIGRGIQNVRNLGRAFLRLVTLASCQTAVAGLLDMFSSVALQLGQSGLPAVLAMQDRIGMDAALEFTTSFYQRLLEVGLVDLAANEARQGLLTAKSSQAHVPVLFSRLKDNQLIEPVQFKLPRERQPFEPEMIRIGAGEFFMGASPNDPAAEACEKKAGRVDLPAYWIGKYPVTNQEYAAFVQDTGRPAPDLNWAGHQPAPGKERCPVVGVTWHDAQAYCQWLEQRTQRHYRLPNEAEWEKAARGAQDQRIYPWGDQFDSSRCHQDAAYQPGSVPPQVVPVDNFKAQSPYGCFDLVGNVREWTNTIWGEKMHSSKGSFSYPWQADERETPETATKYFRIYRILRGGGAGDDQVMLRCSARDWDAPEARFQCGFRVARY